MTAIAKALGDAANEVEESGIVIPLTPNDLGIEDGRFEWTALEKDAIRNLIRPPGCNDIFALNPKEQTIELQFGEGVAIYAQRSQDGDVVFIFGPPGGHPDIS